MSAPNMVERVARALCSAIGHTHPDTMYANRTANGDLDVGSSPAWMAYRAEARAAIAAMREPTEAVATAVAQAGGCIWDSGPAWTAGVDAALNEGTSS